MEISTLNYFITSIPSANIPATILEEVSFLSFPEATKYLDSEEVEAPDSLVKKVIAKSKA